jgi:hypothetical protein
MKSLPYLLIILLIFALPSYAAGATYPLSLRYQPAKGFPSLQQKIGSTLGIAPFKDERSDTSYMGVHYPVFGGVNYFKSDPSPLEKAIKEAMLGPLFQYGVKIVPISSWDGKPESLKDIETDSVLTMEMKRFWIEGSASVFRTNVKTSIHLVIHLGVKKEGKVFTKNVEIEREATLPRITPEGMERTLNDILTEIFDSFFSNPY